MSANKQTVERYIDGYNKANHAQIMSCLTDDIVWDIPGEFHIVGKADFDKEIANVKFKVRPSIKVTRMTEENDVVIVEGGVTVTRGNGETFEAVFCDAFEMRDSLIKRLITHFAELK